jgi:hypothetical protein
MLCGMKNGENVSGRGRHLHPEGTYRNHVSSGSSPPFYVIDMLCHLLMQEHSSGKALQ